MSTGAQRRRQGTKELREAARRRRPQVLSRDGYRCVRCGFGGLDKQRALVVDHVVPVSRGGGSKLPNLQTLCLNCNALKADEAPSTSELARVAARRPHYTPPRAGR
jgi:5-methylcytosine-specific restriction endonuclease McrA